MDGGKKKIGQIFVEHGIIDSHQLSSALSHQKKWGKRLGETLVHLGFISENTLMKVLSKHFNIPSINLTKLDIAPEVLRLVPKNLAEKYLLVPLAVKHVNQKKRLILAMSDPTNLQAIDELQFLANHTILPMISTLSQINRAIARYYGGEESQRNYVEDRSGISMIATNPGDSQMAVIRGGNEDIVRIGEKKGPIPMANTTTAAKDTPEYLLTPNDLSELDGLFSGFEREPASGDGVGPNTITGVTRLLDKLSEKSMIGMQDKKAVQIDDDPFRALVALLKNKLLLSDEEVKQLLDKDE